jgi:uncharacterized coiled-coil protein SlyX
LFLLSIVIENQIDYRSNNKSNIIDGKSIIVNEGAQKRSSSRKACFCVPLLRNKCFVLLFVLFILVLTLGMLIFVLIKGKDRIIHLENKLRIKENQSNQMMEQLNKRLLEQQETIEQLNQNITKLNNNIMELNPKGEGEGDMCTRWTSI